MVKLHHPGHVVTLAMMIAGIVMSKKAQLSEMSNEVPVKVAESLYEDQELRGVFAKNARVYAEKYFNIQKIAGQFDEVLSA